MERSPPPAPADVRRRSLNRLRALLPLAPIPRPEAPSAGRWPLVAAVSSVAALLLLVLPGRRQTSEAAPAPIARPPAGDALTRASQRPAATWSPPALLTPPLAPRRPPPVQLERGLIGHWSFDQDPSGLALDRSGHDNTCRLQAAADASPGAARLVEGISGQALQLDGTRYLSCARAEPLAGLQTALSISLWAKPGPRNGHPQVLIARQIGSSIQRYFSITLRDGQVELMSHTWRSVTRRPLPVGRGPWIHIAAVHRDDGKTALYVDGMQVGRSNRSVRAHLGGGSNVLTIGGTGAADGAPFEGALDEVRIYNRALGQAELRALGASAFENLPAADKIALSHQ